MLPECVSCAAWLTSPSSPLSPSWLDHNARTLLVPGLLGCYYKLISLSDELRVYNWIGRPTGCCSWSSVSCDPESLNFFTSSSPNGNVTWHSSPSSWSLNARPRVGKGLRSRKREIFRFQSAAGREEETEEPHPTRRRNNTFGPIIIESKHSVARNGLWVLQSVSHLNRLAVQSNGRWGRCLSDSPFRLIV